MAITYDSTTGLRALLGGNLVSDIDTGFLSLAQDIAAALGHAMQEGAIDAGSFEVTQASGGASMVLDIASNVGTGAFVQNDSATGTPLVYIPPTGSKSTVTATTAHATLPRVDAVVVSTAGVVSIVAGTATSGATLDNARDGSHGGAVIPSNALQLADVLIPATDTTLSNNQIRDRRRWAHGANLSLTRNSNAAAGNDYTATTSTFAMIDSTNLAPRVECSGAPVIVRLTGVFSMASAGGAYFSPQVDSAGVSGMGSIGVDFSTTAALGLIVGGSSELRLVEVSHSFTPTAGSHIIAPAWAGGGAMTFRANAAQPLQWSVTEIVRQNTKNNITTSG